MYELIVTEKPSTAKKLADALAHGKPIKRTSKEKVPYYELTRNGADIVVACAVGHLYTVAEKEKSFKYPRFDIHWVPVYEVSKSSGHAEKYLKVIKRLAKDAKSVVVACDFDIEGEVIGWNIMRFACNKQDGRRMKFSTLTPDELAESYDHARPTIEWGQARAGETRHFLDWLYGINMSRALTLSVKAAGSFKLLSSGRVQTPALKIVADRDKEISAFIPVPYFEVHSRAQKDSIPIDALHIKGKIFEEATATAIYNACKGKNARVSDLALSRYKQKPPHPFDLGSLQTEAYRVFGYSPKMTLSLAQSLYVDGYTSYPRTSSQQLPQSLKLKDIMLRLAKQNMYKGLVDRLFAFSKNPMPHEGKKTDPAHPAIYPTGNVPKALPERRAKLYDLIVKRFLATHGPDAVRESAKLTLAIGAEQFTTQGSITIEEGWHSLYAPYVRQQEAQIPHLKVDEQVTVISLDKEAKETQPPRRFTPASLVSELEKRGLGTKATRADIIEGLYARGYIKEKSIEVTDLGHKTIEIIEKFIPEIVDVNLTRHFEEELEQIRENSYLPDKTLDEAKVTLTKILTHFKSQEKTIGEQLLAAHRETQDEINSIAACQKCGEGTLMIRRSRFGRFLACSKYPECKTTFRLPQSGLLKSAEGTCQVCNAPRISIQRPKRGPQIVCLNLDCSTKLVDSNGDPLPALPSTQQACPKCGKPLILRKSLYGAFVGCSGFPKCRFVEGKNKNEKPTSTESEEVSIDPEFGMQIPKPHK